MNYVRFAALLESVLLFGCALPKPQAVIRPVRTLKPAAQAKEKTSLPSPPIGNVRNAQYAPEPLPGETARDLVQTKQGLQDANRDIHAIQQNQEKLATTVQSLAEQTLDGQRKLTNLVSTLNGRLQRIEGGSEETADSSGANENKVPAGGV